MYGIKAGLKLLHGRMPQNRHSISEKVKLRRLFNQGHAWVCFVRLNLMDRAAPFLPGRNREGSLRDLSTVQFGAI